MTAPAKPTAKQTKFIFVTGGVVSSLGKGLASASIGSLLETRGLKITIQKLDPYLNVDSGGTVGDIESLPFLEAIRQLRFEVGATNFVSVHVTLVPYIGAAGEMKT